MKLRLSLSLPRDSASVPLARRTVATMLGTVGVSDECRTDILLALAEACANAVAHARMADSFEVRIAVDVDSCSIEVVDTGAGFDPSAVPTETPVLGESGRGLQIIRAVADHVDVRPNQPSGTLLRFSKRLDRTLVS